MKTPINYNGLCELGFEETDEDVSLRLPMSQLKLVLMPLNTVVLEIYDKETLLNGQRLNFNYLEDIQQFINFFKS